MKDSVITALEAVNEIEDDHEPFTNPEDIASCNDFIPDNHESSDCSDCSDSNDDEEDDFCKDEVIDVVENNIVIKEEDNTTKEEPILLAQPLLTLLRGRNNFVSVPSKNLNTSNHQ